MLLSLMLAAAAPAAVSPPTPEGYTEYPVRLRVSVDKAGKITDCVVINQAPAKLAEASCKVALQKASFRPARNAKGRPIAATRTILVRYQIADK